MTKSKCYGIKVRLTLLYKDSLEEEETKSEKLVSNIQT